MDRLVGIGVVGYGYWGPNLVRNFAISEVARVVSVSDLDPSKLAVCKRLILLSQRLRLPRSPQRRANRCHRGCDARPDSTHELALAALKAGKHVLVEKTARAQTSGQVLRLNRRGGAARSDTDGRRHVPRARLRCRRFDQLIADKTRGDIDHS